MDMDGVENLAKYKLISPQVLARNRDLMSVVEGGSK